MYASVGGTALCVKGERIYTAHEQGLVVFHKRTGITTHSPKPKPELTSKPIGDMLQQFTAAPWLGSGSTYTLYEIEVDESRVSEWMSECGCKIIEFVCVLILFLLLLGSRAFRRR